MKLHDFNSRQPSPDAQKFRSLGKALASGSQYSSVAEAAKPTAASTADKKQLTITKDVNGDGVVDAVDAAVAELAGDHKVVKNKIRNYD